MDIAHTSQWSMPIVMDGYPFIDPSVYHLSTPVKVCYQCGTLGKRHPDGRCREKWRPGPQGTATMCDNCGQRYKRNLARRQLEADKQRSEAGVPDAIDQQRLHVKSEGSPVPHFNGLYSHRPNGRSRSGSTSSSGSGSSGGGTDISTTHIGTSPVSTGMPALFLEPNVPYLDSAFYQMEGDLFRHVHMQLEQGMLGSAAAPTAGPAGPLLASPVPHGAVGGKQGHAGPADGVATADLGWIQDNLTEDFPAATSGSPPIAFDATPRTFPTCHAGHPFGEVPHGLGQLSQQDACAPMGSVGYVSPGATIGRFKNAVGSAKVKAASAQRRLGAPAFLCTLCGQDFTKKHNLESHYRSHMNDRPYECCHCCKTFVRRNDCMRHEQSYCKSRPAGLLR